MPAGALTHSSQAHHPNPSPVQGVQLEPAPATACSPPITSDGVWPHNSAIYHTINLLPILHSR